MVRDFTVDYMDRKGQQGVSSVDGGNGVMQLCGDIVIIRLALWTQFTITSTTSVLGVCDYLVSGMQRRLFAMGAPGTA